MLSNRASLGAQVCVRSGGGDGGKCVDKSQLTALSGLGVLHIIGEYNVPTEKFVCGCYNKL